MSLSMAVGLQLGGFYGPFQTKPFYEYPDGTHQHVFGLVIIQLSNLLNFVRVVAPQCTKPSGLTSDIEGKGNLIFLPLYEHQNPNHSQVVGHNKNRKRSSEITFLYCIMFLENFGIIIRIGIKTINWQLIYSHTHAHTHTHMYAYNDVIAALCELEWQSMLLWKESLNFLSYTITSTFIPPGARKRSNKPRKYFSFNEEGFLEFLPGPHLNFLQKGITWLYY